jgi:nucleotide-binding universal stress UspA family protein
VIVNIMVATDGSAGGDRAVDFAAKVVLASGAGSLTIVTVGGKLTKEERELIASAVGASDDTVDSLSEQVLNDACLRAQRSGVSAIQERMESGNVVGSIVAAIERDRPDAIAVGRSGHGKIADLLLGGVSHKLVNLAPCPVIVVP